MWFVVGSYFLLGWDSNKSFTVVECYTFPHLFGGCGLRAHLPDLPLNWIRHFLRSLLLTLCNSIAVSRYVLITHSIKAYLLKQNIFKVVCIPVVIKDYNFSVDSGCFLLFHPFIPLSVLQFIGFTRPFYSMDRCFMLCSTWWLWFLWDLSWRESWDLSACFTWLFCWQRPMPYCIFL